PVMQVSATCIDGARSQAEAPIRIPNNMVPEIRTARPKASRVPPWDARNHYWPEELWLPASLLAGQSVDARTRQSVQDSAVEGETRSSCWRRSRRSHPGASKLKKPRISGHRPRQRTAGGGTTGEAPKRPGGRTRCAELG